MVGNATIKAKLQACSQIETIFDTNPTLNTEMINDIMQDIKNAIKNEKTNL